MNKFFTLLTACLLPTLSVAQSTCQTRVDAHQHATTRQRVAYCLTPDYPDSDNTYAGLVFSEVSTYYPQPDDPVQLERPTAKPGHFQANQVAVSRNYIETTQFPELSQAPVDPRNVSVEANPALLKAATPTLVYENSVQENYVSPECETSVPLVQEDFPISGEENPIAYLEEEPLAVVQDEFVYVSSPTVRPRQTRATVQSLPEESLTVSASMAPVERFMSDEVDSEGNLLTEQIVAETRAGVQARQAKPSRRWGNSVSAVQASRRLDDESILYTYQEDLNAPYEPTPSTEKGSSYAPVSDAAMGNINVDNQPTGGSMYAPATESGLETNTSMSTGPQAYAPAVTQEQQLSSGTEEISTGTYAPYEPAVN